MDPDSGRGGAGDPASLGPVLLPETGQSDPYQPEDPVEAPPAPSRWQPAVDHPGPSLRDALSPGGLQLLSGGAGGGAALADGVANADLHLPGGASGGAEDQLI